MPPKKPKKPSGPTPIEATVHGDKRTNIPTAETDAFVTPEVEAPVTLRYPRDPSLDPQLVWKGKDEQDADDLVVDAPPIYIQEKIQPRVLFENLRKTAKDGEAEPELSLFDAFDGLAELDQIEFYQHDANWSNRMILGDGLQVMASLAERERLRGKVQMIYIDPPYGIKFGSNWQVRASKRDVKDGRVDDVAREVEQIKAFRDTWELGIHSYLSYLRDRLTVAKELLTESGSCFVQIGDENVHLVRSLMDEVFGAEHFVAQIAFVKTTSSSSDRLDGVADYVVWFAADRGSVRFRQLFRSKELGGLGGSGYTRVMEPTGATRPLTADEVVRPGSLGSARPYMADNLTSQRPAQGTDLRSYVFDGREYSPGRGTFKTDRRGLDALARANRLTSSGKNLAYVRFIDDFPAVPLANVWSDTLGQNQFGGDKTYVVQTAVRVVERCMLMCTDPGDLVLDPTCGSGTTAYVAEQWGRRWITIDTSRVALALARQRLMGAKFPYYLLADSEAGRQKEGDVTGVPLAKAPVTNDIRHGFVYERVQHITLKSIANNPDIKEGMTREQIDEAIKRHADYELLYDKPYEDNRRVRVTGPFTVESLSPHRSLAFARHGDEATEPASEQVGDLAEAAASFEQMILANLEKAGIQNGRKDERITFELLEPFASERIHAVGVRDDGTGSRVGIAIGPQYGTVGPKEIKAAALAAINAKDIDLLCVLAFAFDPQAVTCTDEFVAGDDGFDVAAERQLGRVPVLLVRMNADLVMGEQLKKTGAGNLFTVFGEPDIVLKEEHGECVVELLGVDVYDPNSGELRSAGTDQVALWMIDTDYNGESFFVRHCYFTGGNDPFKRLKTALKAEIDEDAWNTLYQTVSRPFPKPTSGKIAVKVINDYGDEVMKIFEVS